MKSTILSAVFISSAVITFLIYIPTTAVEAKSYPFLDNTTLLTQTYDQAINAVINTKKVETPPVATLSAEMVTDKDKIKALIREVASQYNISPDLFLNIAICESGLNPNAQNGIYGGLYQFSSSTWVSNRKAMSADPDPSLRFNASEAIQTAGYKISKDGTAAWPECQFHH